MSQLQVTGEAKIRDIQGPVVANSGVITALDGAASQYVRGDGTLADFPTSTGGGSSVSYYLNSSVSQGTIGGVAYRELSKEPIIGAGTDITISANGYVASYITDANDPDVLSVPGGNFNCEFYFSVNNNTGNPTTYAELYKYDGTTFTLLGSSQAVPESLNQGTTIAPYYFAIPVATAALALTDRLAIRIYVSVDGRVVTLHTENSHLCQVVTTFSKGMVSLNNLTDQSQFITTGTSGTNFNIVSSGDTHTFNLPVASATNTGKLSNTDWSTFNNKLSTATAAATYVPYTGATTNVDLGFNNFDANQINGFKIVAKLDGTNSGSLILRTGTSGYSYGNDSISLISSPTSANTLTIISDISSVTKIAQFGLGSLTATRTFTLPDLSGTLALTSDLNGYVPYNGATTGLDLGIYSYNGNSVLINGNGTTQNGTLLFKQGGGLAFNTTGYSGIGILGTTSMHFNFNQSSGVYKQFNFNVLGLTNNTLRTLNIPDATGTIALTSDLSSYVPYTGATSNVNLGVYDISVSGIKVESNVSGGTAVNIKQNSTTLIAGAGYISIGAKDLDTLLFQYGGATNSDYKAIRLKTTNIPNTTSRVYEFPNADGTLALTSNLSAYLPLTGGTLTGALSGTSATFSGNLTIDTDTLFVDSTNNRVGIGTTTPNTWASNLVVYNNQLTITGGGYDGTFADSIFFGGNSENTTYRNKISNSLSANAANQKMKFSVASGANTWVDALTLTGTGAATFSSSVSATNAVFERANDSGSILRIGNAGSTYFDFSRSAATGALLIQGNQTGNNNIILAPTSGNVGIGTSSPTERLEILGPDGSGAAVRWRMAGGRKSGYLYSDSAGVAIYDTNLNDAGIYLAQNTQIDFRVNGSQRMLINSSGNVGIGTSAPTNTLTLQNTGENSLEFHRSNAMQGMLGIPSASNQIITGSALNDFCFRATSKMLFATGGDTERMRITSDGRFLVGATATDSGCKARIVYDGINQNGLQLFDSTNNTASTIFHLFGINNPTPINIGSILRLSNTNAVSFSTTSDYRLKEDLKEINGLEKVLAIKVYDFKWKGLDSRTDGVIAHELQEILPYAVNGEKDGLDKNGNPSYQGVDYSKIVPILIKSIQELQAKIVTLESKIN